VKWSWRIARFAGIDVYIHATFFILVAFFGFHYWKTFGTLTAAVEGMTFILVLFACVVLHEFGHALTARRYNIVTERITLLPIGGVASMEKLPEDPWQEIKVALAGPAVNGVIVLLLGLWFSLNPVEISDENLLHNEIPFAYRLMVVNIFLALFNLLPAFPMDGGRVLRAALALRMPHHLATDKAARVGKSFAFLFGFLGLLYNPFLLLIAIFLWFGAEAENRQEQLKASLGNATVGDAMLTEFHLLSPGDPLSRAVQLTLTGSQRDFPVVDSEQRWQGILTHQALLQGLQEKGQQARVIDLALPPLHTVSRQRPLHELLTEPQLLTAQVLAVEDRSRIVGIIDLRNIMELIDIQDALAGRKQTLAREGQGIFK
jgi:Zn-dependent protease